MQGLIDTWRRWRRILKNAAPFVRRREYRIVQAKYAALAEALNGAASPASKAAITVVKPCPAGIEGDVCLFVSHGASPRLKPHAAHHIGCLLDAGIQVVLIINTSIPAAALIWDEALLQRLSGVLVRENSGFDFGAWAHVFGLLDRARWQRLFLVNDSMVGPLEQQGFTTMVQRIRQSSADILGLTLCVGPVRHLQSYFLVIQGAALTHPALLSFMQRVLNFPAKGQVVDVYEMQFTTLMERAGLRCEAVFAALTDDVNNGDDTALRWEALIRAGFPYVKTRIIERHPDHPAIRLARQQSRFDTP